MSCKESLYDENCSNCYFSRYRNLNKADIEDSEIARNLECRIRSAVAGYWSTVEETDWCGEWTAR